MIWTCVQTEMRRERIAQEHLTRAGFTIYLPRIKIRRPGHAPKITPLFPSYLFAHIDLSRWISMRWSIAVLRILMDGERPARVPERIIMEVRKREGRDGLIDLTPHSPLRKGAKVIVMRGSFKGLEGVFEATSPHDRVQILLSLLGQAVPVELPAADVAVV